MRLQRLETNQFDDLLKYFDEKDRLKKLDTITIKKKPIVFYIIQTISLHTKKEDEI